MIKLNTYINEAWSGVKQQVNKAEIESWCDEIGIQNYTINSQGEIDVDNCVNLMNKQFKELPYKFGKVKGYFSVYGCNKLKSLKNCPNKVGRNFNCTYCKGIESLEGCPKEVGGCFYCSKCKQKFTKEEVRSLCDVKRNIYV